MEPTTSATTTSTATIPEAPVFTCGEISSPYKVANGFEFRLDCTRYWKAFDNLARIEHTTFEACIKECSMVEACTIAHYDA